jgi:hypothetical protein
MKFQILCLLFFFLSTSVFAKGLDGDTWLGGLSLAMGTHTVDDAKGDYTFTDFTVGYVRPKGLYLGGIFGSGNYGDDKFSHMGVSLGYALNGWGILAHYLLGGTYSSGGTEYKEGTGTQFDLGYMFKTGFPIFIGIQYSSRSMTYKAKAANGSDLKEGDSYFALRLVYPF